jgi:hypothetical protein
MMTPIIKRVTMTSTVHWMMRWFRMIHTYITIRNTNIVHYSAIIALPVSNCKDLWQS